MTEYPKTGLPQIVIKQGSDMEIAVGALAIEEWLVETVGPEWWDEMWRGDVPWNEAIERYWAKRLPTS